MNPYFPEIKKNFGFGFMRLPVCGENIDLEQTEKMVDLFLDRGFNYFDTAHPYHQGQSEVALRHCLTSRYPRDRYILADKLSDWFFEKEEDIRPLFEKQLHQCGVEYFDFYLFHAMNARRHEKYTLTRAYDIAQELKAEGKIRHVAMSFHDTADVLDRILTDRPEIEAVQLQFNYVDYEDPKVQSRACYEVCRKHGKPVIVMEPVKGGSLVDIPQEGRGYFTSGSPASYAVRFAAGFDGIFMVLSGMSDLAQLEENTAYMMEYKPLSPEEMEAVAKVRTLYQAQHRIPCTACRYCVDGCPAGIDIPAVFACMNDHRKGEGTPKEAYAALENKASACIACGQCEAACPQGLQIRKLLEAVAKEFE